MANTGYGHPSTDTGCPTTAQPERDVQPGNPAMVGAAPAPQKKGIAEKVKGLLGGHGHRTDAAQQQPAVYGDATPGTGTPESTKVGLLDKMKTKAGLGHHGQYHDNQLPTALSSSSSSSDDENLTGTGHTTDPTGPAAGSAFKDHDMANTGAPVTGVGYGNTDPDFNESTDVQSSAAVHDGWPRPTNPHHTAGTFGGPQPTNPTGTTNQQGGAVIPDQQGNLNEGPRDDNVKKEGFVSKIMDKLHSPKGKTSNTTSTTY